MSNTHASPYGTLPPASPVAARKPISLPRLNELRARGEKITMLTAYDATFAAVADAAGVECILVGDSLGMVCQGLTSTVGVTLDTMRYHVESVARGIRRVQGTAWIIGDLPFGSYQESKEQALRSATVLMQASAHMVKLEGGGWTTDIVHFLVERGIPVCATRRSARSRRSASRALDGCPCVAGFWSATATRAASADPRRHSKLTTSGLWRKVERTTTPTFRCFAARAIVESLSRWPHEPLSAPYRRLDA